MKKSAFLTLCFTTFLCVVTPSFAVDVVVNDPTTGQPLAKQPQNQLPTPNTPTLAQLNKPSDNQLSQANQELLVKNAELQRQVDSLTTQNNVLINEQTSDLFVKGAYVAIFSALAGFGLSWLIFGRNKSGW